MDKRTKLTSKIRRERALKLRAAAGGGHGSDSCGGGGGGGPGANSEDSAEEEQRGPLGAPIPRIKPPRPRPRKNKIMKDSTEPLYEEDVVSGFAFLQFETYEDLELCVRDAEKGSSRGNKQGSGKHKQDKNNKRNKIKIKHEKGGTGSHSSSEQGYICDSESDGDNKASDAESDLFRATKGCVESGIESRASGEGPGAATAASATAAAPGSLGSDGTGGAGSFPSAATATSGSPPTATAPGGGGIFAPAPIRPKPELPTIPPEVKQEFKPEFKPHITQPYSNGPVEFGHYQGAGFSPTVVGDVKTGGLTTTVGTTTAAVTAAASTVTPTAANLPDVKPTATLYPTPISSPAATPTLARPTPTTLVPPTLPHAVTAGTAPIAASTTTTTTTSTSTTTTTTSTSTTCSSTTAPHPRLSNGPLAYSGGGPGVPPSTTTSSGPAPAVGHKYSVNQLVSPAAPSPVYNNIKPEPSLKGTPVARPPAGVVPTSAPGPKTPIVTPGVIPTTPTGVPHPSPVGIPHGSGPPTPTTPTGQHHHHPHHPNHPTVPGVHPGTAPGPLGHPSGQPVHQYVVKTEPGLHPVQHKPTSTSGIPRQPSGPHQHHGTLPANATIKIEPGQHPGSHPVSHPSGHPGAHPRITPPGHPRTTPPAHPGQRQTPPHSLHSSSDPLRRPYHSPYYSVGSSLPPSCAPTTTLTRPWPSPVSSLSGSSAAAAAAAANSRLPGLSRPILPPPPSLPLGVHHPPVSAPLPPTGMFAPPPVPPTQPLGSNPLLSSSQFPSEPLGQVDLLRRELDARYLASQDRSSLSLGGLGGLGPPPSFLRAEMHHHQHQHTHVHQHLLPQMAPPPPIVPPGSTTIFSHPPSSSLIGGSATPSMFKEVSKVGLESSPSLYRASGGGLSSLYPPGLNPMVHSASTSTPFTPPQHLASVAPKIGGDPTQRKPPKTGRWNAMHVRIAWEIYYHQQKQPSEKGVPPQNKLGPPSCHPPPTSVGPPGAPMFPTLPRPPDLGPIMGPGPSHLPHLSHASLTPSIPGLAGLRYAAAASGATGAPPPHPGGAPSSFHQATTGTMPGPHGPPPHGSMFSRDGLPPGLSLPTPTSADAWRLRAPTPYGAGAAPPWPVKTEVSAYDREREERERREREERERREREKRSERDEKERREREEREKREREERERERERRAEHDKDRVARSLDPHGGHPQRRDGSRSPLRTDGAPHPHPGHAPQLSHPQRSNSNSGASSGMKTETGRPDSRPGSRPGSGRHSDHRSMVKHEVKDDIMIVGSKGHPPQLPPHSVAGMPPHSYSHLSSGHHPLSMAPTTVTSSISAADRARLLGAPYPGVPPPGLPGSLPPGYPPHLSTDPFRDPYRAAAGPDSVLMRDPYRAAAAQESALRAHELAAREALLARGDPLLAREHMAREREALIAREEHLRAAASNPLSSLILTERYREQQHHHHQQAAAAAHAAAAQQAHQAEAARDYLIRSGQLAPPPHGAPPPGSHPGLYPPTSLSGVHHPPGAPTHPSAPAPPTSMHPALYPPTSSHSAAVPPHHYPPLGLKTGSPLGGGPPGPPMHPAGLHSLPTHPGAPPGSHPGAPPPLGPGLPPPLIPSMRGPSPSTLPRPPDKKD